jgi:photosynthetic reaction center H subunit
MGTGAITQYVDVAQLVLYAFWVFFFALIYYLQRESKREGYPMHSDRPGRSTVPGLLPMPRVKTYHLYHGGTVDAPRERDMLPSAVPGTPVAGFPGAPLEPNGDPIGQNIGPGSYTLRIDQPELDTHGRPLIQPLRRLEGFEVARQDADPRGMKVIGEDGVVAGRVHDLWLDSAEMIVRFLEVSVSGAALGPHVLLPIGFARISNGQVTVRSLRAAHFAGVPRTRHPDEVTSLEEDKIMGYYGGGTLYADPERQEAFI